jgi:hypothetical protein
MLTINKIKKNILLYNVLMLVCLGNAVGCAVGFFKADGDVSYILMSSITGVVSLALVYVCNEKKKVFKQMQKGMKE